MRKKLPIGIQTFREIREEGYYYVDKTGFARRLIDGTGYNRGGQHQQADRHDGAVQRPDLSV